MTIQSSFRDRDHEGLLVTSNFYNYTTNITGSPGWTQIQIGGPANTSIKKEIRVVGGATSPASLGSNPDDNAIYLEVRHTPRGQDFNSGSAISHKIPLVKWIAGETSTARSMSTPAVVDLNTYGTVDGNIYIRLIGGDTGLTFTSVDFVVCTYGNNTTVFNAVAPTSETNNIRSTGAAATGNTVNEIPSSTAGWVQFEFSQFGYKGDIKTDCKFGMSPTSAIGSDPKYYWRWQAGDATGNDPAADAVHDGVVVANNVVVAEGDSLRVSRDASGNYTYLKNGVSQGTGGSTDTTAQKGDFSLATVDSRILGTRMDIGAGTVSPTYENLSNAETF